MIGYYSPRATSWRRHERQDRRLRARPHDGRDRARERGDRRHPGERPFLRRRVQRGWVGHRVRVRRQHPRSGRHQQQERRLRPRRAAAAPTAATITPPSGPRSAEPSSRSPARVRRGCDCDPRQCGGNRGERGECHRDHGGDTGSCRGRGGRRGRQSRRPVRHAGRRVSPTWLPGDAVITWANPASITLRHRARRDAIECDGQRSRDVRLHAASGHGARRRAAGQTLSAAFTPTDAVNYTTATKTVAIDVTAPTPPTGATTRVSVATGGAQGNDDLLLRTTTSAPTGVCRVRVRRHQPGGGATPTTPGTCSSMTGRRARRRG